jgi:hypothetical protein
MKTHVKKAANAYEVGNGPNGCSYKKRAVDYLVPYGSNGFAVCGVCPCHSLLNFSKLCNISIKNVNKPFVIWFIFYGKSELCLHE